MDSKINEGLFGNIKILMEILSLEATSTNAITIIATKCDDVDPNEYLSFMDDEQQDKFNEMKRQIKELEIDQASLLERSQIDENEEVHNVKQGQFSLQKLEARH